MNVRAAATVACAVTMLGSSLAAEDLSRYRNFALGSSLADVASATSTAESEAKTLHLRPALLQDLEWRPSRWSGQSSTASTDPVDQIVFSFYDGQLFRVVVDYARDRTEGMTAGDLIDAVSGEYGAPATRPAHVRLASRVEATSGTPLARWEDGGHTVVLYRTTIYREAFRLIVTSVALDDRARKAEDQAARLDEKEAPVREIARQKKEHEDALAASEKTRAANKKAFQP